MKQGELMSNEGGLKKGEERREAKKVNWNISKQSEKNGEEYGRGGGGEEESKN